MKTDELIVRLKDDLTPVAPIAPLMAVMAVWLAASVVYVAVLTGLLGPFRPGAAEQFLTHPRFLVEMLLGFGAMLAFAVVCFAKAVPGREQGWRLPAAWLLLVAWVGHFVFGYQFPVLESSMVGKREHCGWEAYLYSVPPMLAAVWLQRRRFPLNPVHAAAYAAIAAGMMPALIMQIACMYEPGHILRFHVAPIGILAGVTAVAMYVVARSSRGTSTLE